MGSGESRELVSRPNSLQHLPLPRPLKVWPMKAKEFVIKMKNEFKLLKPLCLVLKQFLAHKGLNNAYHGGLSSYGLILMIVHILYQDSQAQLQVGDRHRLKPPSTQSLRYHFF